MYNGIKYGKTHDQARNEDKCERAALKARAVVGVITLLGRLFQRAHADTKNER